MTILEDIENNANDAQDLVSEQFSITQNWATTMLNQTLAFLNALNTTASFTVPEITLVHSLPDSLNIDDFDAVAPGELTLSYTPPTRPSFVVNPLDGIFLFAGVDYSSLINSDIIAKILDTFQNGGTGLDSDVEAAIWARALARKELKDSALYTEAEDYFASRGWTLPPGMLSGRLTEIQKEISREDAQLNYEVMIKQADLADQNTRFNLEQAINLEKILRDYYVNNEIKNLEISKAISTATVQEFTSKVEAAKLDIQMYETDNAAMIALIDAQVKAYIGLVQAYQARADAYRAVVEAKAAVYGAEASVVKTEADIEIAKLDVQVRSFLGIAQLDASIAEAAAKISAQIAAGAMSAVNAGVSFSYGASQSANGGYSDSTSHSYSTSVDEILHSYE